MEWITVALCILVIILSLSVLAFSSKIEIKMIVFMIILANVGIIILGRKLDNFIDMQSLLNQLTTFQNQASTLQQDTINNGLSNNNASDVLMQIDTLNKNITDLQNQVNTAVNQNPSYNKNINYLSSDTILNDVEVYKQMQLSKLNDLQAQLLKTQQLNAEHQQAISTNKYKPIKIYSSCIVSDANGSYST